MVPIDKASILLTMVMAFVFLREPISLLKGVSMTLIGAGTWLMIQRKDEGDHAGRGAWLVYAVLSAVFAAATSILGKVGIEAVESNLGTAIRTGVVLILAWGIVLAQGKQREIREIGKKGWVFIVLSGFATGFSWLNGQASIVVPIDKVSIVVTILFSRIVLKERLTGKAWAGFVILICGTLLLLV